MDSYKAWLAYSTPTNAVRTSSVLASISKDGLLLFAEPETLAGLTPLKVLTGVYLAGVLLPY